VIKLSKNKNKSEINVGKNFSEKVPQAKEREFKAIITVVGLDKPGIVASVSKLLADNHININDISQSFTQDFFTMILIVDFTNSDSTIEEISSKLEKVEREIGLKIDVFHEDVFRAMHRI